jgi:hypothetical protein
VFDLREFQFELFLFCQEVMKVFEDIAATENQMNDKKLLENSSMTTAMLLEEIC